MRKRFPQGQNFALLRILFEILSLVINIWFLHWLTILPFRDLDWVFDLALSGMIFSFFINFFAFIYLFRQEAVRSTTVRDWLVDHFYIVIFVMFLSILNTQNGKILSSEIFGLAMFSAPVSDDMNAQLKFFSLTSTIFHAGVVLFCQIYTTYYLNTFQTMATIGFIFNGITFFVNIVSKSVSKYRKSVINKMRSSTQASMELSERSQERSEPPLKAENEIDVNPVIE